MVRYASIAFFSFVWILQFRLVYGQDLDKVQDRRLNNKTYSILAADNAISFNEVFKLKFSKPLQFKLRLIKFGDLKVKKRTIDITNWISIYNCTFFPKNVSDDDYGQLLNFYKLSVLDCEQSNFKGSVAFFGVTLYKTSTFRLRKDTLTGMEFLFDSGNFLFEKIYMRGDTISEGHFNGSLTVDSLQNKTKRLYFSSQRSNVAYNFRKLNLISSYFDFLEDTLKESFFLNNSISQTVNVKKSIITENVTINNKTSKNQNVYFDSCLFKCNNINVNNIERLYITNCVKFEHKVAVIISQTYNPLNKVNIELTGSDVSQIDFDFKENYELVFASNSSSEIKTSTYQNLLDKYKRENKSESYKWVDIQFKRFKYNENGLLGKIWDKVDDFWWNYGYAKQRILLWTFGLLIVFLIINLIIGKNLLIFYSVFGIKKSQKTKTQTFETLNQFILLFVLTLYIFFSLRVDFSKIKSNQSGMMIYFFFQYFMGLICLFFLLNAILKI